MNIAERLSDVKSKLTEGVSLCAVSKYHPAEMIKEAYDAGQRIFGESHAIEMRDKHLSLPDDIEWHFIGHLQTNKVKYIAPFVKLIHSADSIKVIEEINKQAANFGRTIDILLEVLVAKEDTKYGFSIDEAETVIRSESLKKYPNVRCVGLMGMATATDDRDEIRKEFQSLSNLFDKLNNECNAGFSVLSMGMSGDYDIAVECGSTLVRVGSYIFGNRQY